jgi:hypothetical protein
MAPLTHLFSVRRNYSCYFSPSIHRKQRWQLSGSEKKLVTRWKAIFRAPSVFVRVRDTDFARRKTCKLDAFPEQSAHSKLFRAVEMQTKTACPQVREQANETSSIF